MRAGAVEVRSGENFFVDPDFISPGQQVAYFGEVTTGDDSSLGAEIQQLPGGGGLVCGRLKAYPGQGGGFVEVWGHDCR